MKNNVTAFGEIMMRLAAPRGLSIADSRKFDACYGGTEANVLACLSHFGHETRYLTALPDTDLGGGVIAQLERYGIDTSCIAVGGEFLGLYFSADGSGSRGSDVIYYRKFSEFTRLNEDSFDLDKAFAGTRIFHISGISFALSDSSRALAFKLMRSARERGIAVSFDFNYRSRLWSVDAARPVLCRAAELADIVFASDLDMSVFAETTADGFMASNRAEYLFLRNRSIVDKSSHKVRVAAYTRGGERYETGEIAFPVEEKIGGGDAFDGGILHGILKGMSLADTVRFGTAAFIVKHTIKGDIMSVPASRVEKVMNGTVGL